jgi:hypothetical protein
MFRKARRMGPRRTRHLKAEGDVEGAVAVYTDDVVHDAVGFPGSPRTGKGI